MTVPVTMDAEFERIDTQECLSSDFSPREIFEFGWNAASEKVAALEAEIAELRKERQAICQNKQINDALQSAIEQGQIVLGTDGYITPVPAKLRSDEMPRVPVEGVELDWIGGVFPVQAEGTIDGQPLYFRARGSGWEFWVGQPWTKDGFSIDGTYGSWPEAGHMPEDIAMHLIAAGCLAYRVIGKAKGEAEEGKGEPVNITRPPVRFDP